MSQRRAAPRMRLATKRRAKKRRSDDQDDDDDQQQSDQEEEEEQEAEQRRRSRGPQQRPMAAAAAAAAGSPPPPAAAAAAAGGGAPPLVPTAAHQALLRFLTLNGRASLRQVEAFFAETKRNCLGAHSKALALHTAWVHLNQYIRFMEMEIRRIKSEVDDQEWWCLIDNTERVAAANASFVSVGAGEDEGEEKSNVRAAPAAAASRGKTMDASAIAKFLNPSHFSEKQIAFFKTLLDAIIRSPCGQVSVGDACMLRLKMAPEKKAQLANDTEVEACLHALKQHGWIRENPHEDRAAGRLIKLCLGERSSAELRAYIDDQCKTECAACHQPCLLGVTCLTQSSESRNRADAFDLAAAVSCPVKLHYICADRAFIKRKRHECPAPECACIWDKYLEQRGVVLPAVQARAE